MTLFLNAVMTAGVIAGGSLAIVYALRFFPIAKPASDQLEMDLDMAPEYLKRARSAAHEAHRAADVIREETRRIKAKPRIKR
jgi:hypothetical protein